MRRYLINPRMNDWYEADASASLAKTVHEPEPRARKTGLLDKDGNAIWAQDITGPIGFVSLSDG